MTITHFPSLGAGGVLAPTVGARVADPYHFDTYHFDTDPDPGSENFATDPN